MISIFTAKIAPASLGDVVRWATRAGHRRTVSWQGRRLMTTDAAVLLALVADFPYPKVESADAELSPDRRAVELGLPVV